MTLAADRVLEAQVIAPSRLHFGLLARGGETNRQHGGAGLMIERPGLKLRARRSDRWAASGPLADRALRAAQDIAMRMATWRGDDALSELGPLHLAIEHAAGEHMGFGTGTQLHLATARALTCLAGYRDLSIDELAKLAGRGGRSGIGSHGFAQGGFLVDGGHALAGADADAESATSPQAKRLPPLLSRMDFPEEWAVLIVIPRALPALHGDQERDVFARLDAIPESVVNCLCRLVLLGLLPAIAERELRAFGAALEEMQQRVGETFASAQSGVFAHSESQALVDRMRSLGLAGVGQSSWGPALYGFSEAPREERERIALKLREEGSFDPPSLFWTTAANQGARWSCAGEAKERASRNQPLP